MMGKGDKPRKVGKNYGDNFDRAFGKKTLKNKRRK